MIDPDSFDYDDDLPSFKWLIITLLVSAFTISALVWWAL